MDNLKSKNDWNGTKDGQTYVAGVEFNPIKGIMVAPNVQVIHPSADNTKTTTNLMVNCSYNF